MVEMSLYDNVSSKEELMRAARRPAAAMMEPA